MIEEDHVYDGDLYKLEPKDLGNFAAEAIAKLLPESARPCREKRRELFGDR